LHPELQLTGVADRDLRKANRFAKFYKVPLYQSLQEMLGDTKVDTILNLTNPRSYFEDSQAGLELRKHAYSEKPLGMNIDETEQLITLAKLV